MTFKLAVSNLAWHPAEEAGARALLKNLGIMGVEIAPTKAWAAPDKAGRADVAAYRDLWENAGIQIISMQSLLFGHPELVIFGDAAARQKTLDYLSAILDVGGALGVSVVVFGSPQNRRRGKLGKEKADAIAADFFRPAGAAAHKNKICFCIEPNPPEAGCDYVNTSEEGLALVAAVGHPGFGLHLDSSALTLAGENIEKAIERAAPQLKHFHMSEPGLAAVPAHAVEHAAWARALKKINYTGWVSIEMKAQDGAGNLSRVETAVRFAQKILNEAEF
jgi:D-psicose/D-tagatose/L-ribulose 3-epimerase